MRGRTSTRLFRKENRRLRERLNCYQNQKNIGKIELD